MWAAPDSHLHALAYPGATAQGLGTLLSVGAVFSPAAALLLALVAMASQLSVMSTAPMSAAMSATVNQTVNHAAVVWAGAGPNPQVDPNGLPGGSAATKIVGGLMFYGLLACTAGIAFGVLAMTVGRFVSHQYAPVTGRIAILAGLASGVIIGAVTNLVNWAFHLGATFSPH